MDSNDLTRMSKRRCVQTAVTLGIAPSTIAYASQDAIAETIDNPSKEVVYPKAIQYNYQGDSRSEIEKEPILTTISRGEWSRRRAAVNLMKRVNQKISNWENSENIKAFFTKMDDSPIEFGVRVEVQEIENANGSSSVSGLSVEDVRNRLPNTSQAGAAKGKWRTEFESIPIRVESNQGRKTSSLTTHDYSEIPAGAACQFEYSTSDGNYHNGTICAPFTIGSSDGWVTAGHVADHVPETMEQPFSGASGTSHTVYNDSERDYAYVEADVSGISPWIAMREEHDPQVYADIGGIVSDSTIQNEAGNSSIDYYLQGLDSGRKLGHCSAYYANGSDDDSRMRHSDDVSGGDSGGPFFKFVNGDAYIAGVIDLDLYIGGSEGSTAEAAENGIGGLFIPT